MRRKGGFVLDTSQRPSGGSPLAPGKQALNDHRPSKEASENGRKENKELNAATDELFNSNSQLGQTVSSNSQAKDHLENTQESLEADVEFLTDLKDKCEIMDTDWDDCSKRRAAKPPAPLLLPSPAGGTVEQAKGFVRRCSACRDPARQKVTMHSAYRRRSC